MFVFFKKRKNKKGFCKAVLFALLFKATIVFSLLAKLELKKVATETPGSYTYPFIQISMLDSLQQNYTYLKFPVLAYLVLASIYQQTEHINADQVYMLHGQMSCRVQA